MQGFKKLSVDDIFPIFMGSCGHLSITPAPNQTYLHFSDTNKQKKKKSNIPKNFEKLYPFSCDKKILYHNRATQKLLKNTLRKS